MGHPALCLNQVSEGNGLPPKTQRARLGWGTRLLSRDTKVGLRGIEVSHPSRVERCFRLSLGGVRLGTECEHLRGLHDGKVLSMRDKDALKESQGEQAIEAGCIGIVRGIRESEEVNIGKT